MSKKRAVEAMPSADAATVRIEIAAKFRHDGVYRNPGEFLDVSPADAADLMAMGFARPAGGYRRRDMQAKG